MFFRARQCKRELLTYAKTGIKHHWVKKLIPVNKGQQHVLCSGFHMLCINTHLWRVSCWSWSNYTLIAASQFFFSSFKEVERKIRANDREYNLSFKYAVSIHVYLCIPSRYQQVRGVSKYMKNKMDFIPYCFSDIPTLPLVLMESGLPYLTLEFQ